MHEDRARGPGRPALNAASASPPPAVAGGSRNLLRGLLPHEACFAFLLALSWTRLGAVRGFADPFANLYLGCLAVSLGLAAACERRPTRLRWRWRLAWYPALIAIVYFKMADFVHATGTAFSDPFLDRADRWLGFGHSPSLVLQSLVHPAITETLAACYLMYYPYLVGGLWLYFLADLRTTRSFYVGFFAIYAVGYLGYSLFPALGPILFIKDQFAVPLEGWAVTRLHHAVFYGACNHVDAFPSLHASTSVYFIVFDRKHHPRMFRWLLLPVIGLCLATVYVRVHYVTDVLVGGVLLVWGLWLARRDAEATR